MESVEVTDLYQACYYLLSGCKVTGLECIPAGTGVSCRISFQGKNLSRIEEAWYSKTAVVNLWSFRTAYTELSGHVQNAKRSYGLTRKFCGRSGSGEDGL